MIYKWSCTSNRIWIRVNDFNHTILCHYVAACLNASCFWLYIHEYKWSNPQQHLLIYRVGSHHFIHLPFPCFCLLQQSIDDTEDLSCLVWQPIFFSHSNDERKHITNILYGIWKQYINGLYAKVEWEPCWYKMIYWLNTTRIQNI